LGTITSYNETELVSLLRGRDNAAFSYLYNHYSGALYAIILQIVGNRELASDVLQEVFVSVWRKIEMYDAAKGRLYTWLLNIARNASIDVVRSKAYQNSQKNQPIPGNVDVFVNDSVTSSDIDNIGLKKILGNLKADQRVLLELAYFKGFTHEEIAQMQQLPLGTVKTRIRSALIALRSYLK
jgi:RNA polymerase sigma factor (sigma-70 family)